MRLLRVARNDGRFFVIKEMTYPETLAGSTRNYPCISG